MSLNSLTLTTGATAIAFTPTGGTSIDLDIASSNGNVVTVVPELDSDFRTKRSITFNKTSPRIEPSAPNGYTQVRTKATVKVPILLTNGKYTVNQIKVEVAYDVETSDAQRLELRSLGAQLFTNAIVAAVWDAQSMG
jgi:hypothetical protein